MLWINKNPEHILVGFSTGFPHKNAVSLLVERSLKLWLRTELSHSDTA